MPRLIYVLISGDLRMLRQVCACTDSPEHSLLAHLVEKLIKVHTSTTPMGGYVCIFKEWHDARAISTDIA